MKHKIILRDVEGALAIESLVRIYSFTSSQYIRSMIIADVCKIFKRSITAEDLLHGFEIRVIERGC